MTRDETNDETEPNDELQGTPGLKPSSEAIADAIEADGLEAVRADAIVSALRGGGSDE